MTKPFIVIQKESFYVLETMSNTGILSSAEKDSS